MPSNAYTARSPVLFLVFNRPDKTRRVFQQIRSVQPSRLYIAADGPRPKNDEDIELCNQVKDIISSVDWPCSVNYLYPKENKGCKVAVSSAINWFFRYEEQGIILEDDCLPEASFFRFCDLMLEKYRLDNRVFSITGSNGQLGVQRGSGSYYFSELSNIWGWASWRRTWNMYELDLASYNVIDAFNTLQKKFSDPLLVNIWMDFFLRLKKGVTDTWDQQFQFMTFFKNRTMYHTQCESDQ